VDDDYDYQQTRKEYRWRVGLGIAGTLLAVGFLVFKYGMRRDRDYDYTPQPVYVPQVSAPAVPVAREPVEFELVVGKETYDVSDQPLALGAGSITLEQNPTQLTAGDGYHFKHRNTVSVSPSESMVIASVDGNVLKLQTMDAKLSDAENKKTLSLALTGTGQTVGTPTPVTRKIAGKDHEGVRHKTTTPMQVEAYLVPVGTTKLGVLLYRQDPSADLSKLDALLDSITEGAGEPMPEFTARVGATATPVFLDKPVQLPLTPPVGAMLRRRAMVLRTMVGNGGSLTFEHPRGMTVSRMPNDQMLAVTLQNDRAAIQLFDLQMRFTVDELKTALLGAMDATDVGEATHTLNGQTVKGRKLRLANLPVEHELYVFERGGKTIGASIQYVASDENFAVDAAMPILLSVR
jgi:hypothetical protein